MSGKTNWNCERDKRRAEQQGTASAYRGGLSKRPRRDDHLDKESSRIIERDVLWTFMWELARCEAEQLPIPVVSRELLGKIGVTSQAVAISWIRRTNAYAGIRTRLATAGETFPDQPGKSGLVTVKPTSSNK